MKPFWKETSFLRKASSKPSISSTALLEAIAELAELAGVGAVVAVGGGEDLDVAGGVLVDEGTLSIDAGQQPGEVEFPVEPGVAAGFEEPEGLGVPLGMDDALVPGVLHGFLLRTSIYCLAR